MSVTIFVSRLGLVTKAAAGKLLCFVQDRATSKPVEGAEIRVLGDMPLTGKTGADGVFVSSEFRAGTVVAIHDGDIATTQSWWNGGLLERPLFYLTTDRPIYRPNQEVNFRLVHRLEKGEALEVKAGARWIVEIRDAKGNKVYEKTHALDAFGAAEGGFTLGDEPALGEYTIFVRTEQDNADLHQHDWRWVGYWSQGPQHFGRFRVDEYRKPEYKVDVDFTKKTVLQGEEVSATIDARYYFGSPVVDADVQYTVHRRPQYSVWRCWAWYYDWYAGEDGDDDEGMGFRHRKGGRGGGGYGLGEQVLQGSGKTDKDGKVRVAFTSQKWDHDAVYTISAKVTDLSRRTVDGSGSCKATRAEFGLSMSLDKYVYKPGDRMNVRVRAATPEDKVVPGAEIAVKVHERRWTRERHEDQLVYEGNAKTDALGVAEFNVLADRPGGYLVVTAEAKDKRGNEVRAEHYAWLCGDSWWGDTVNLNGIDLIPDKKTYEPGETAQILITSQFKNFTLLLTIEGKEIFHHEVVAVKGHAKTVSLKLDRAAYAPNVFVRVVAIQANQVVQKRKMLVVNPASRFLNVEVKADKDQYRPRQKAVYEVITRGADGAPVSAAVSLGLVDESIYALQDEYAQDVRKHFVYRRGNEVGTTTSLEYHDWGRADEKKEQSARQAGAAPAAPAAKALAAESADGMADREGGERRKNKEGGSYAATEVRSKFADTMLWRTVVTGPDGRAKVEVEVPDNLTTWRITARACTADSRFGQTNGDTLVRKEMIVRLEAPRFFTQGDSAIFSAIVHNYLADAKDVKIELEALGVQVGGETSKILKVASEGQARIDWTAKLTSAGSARLTVKALSDQDSDAMQLTVPVFAYGSVRYDSRAGVAEGRTVQKVVLPAGAAKDAAELVIAVNPTHASMVLDSLEYLAGYPYGCVEQTMSRFLPTVIVSKALQRLGIEKKELQAELPSMVQAGLQRLMNFQQQDGGWGWWQNDASNPWITAYVVTGLAMARDADHRIDPHVIARGVGALQRHLNEAKEADLQAYLLYALSVAGSRHDDVRSRLTDRLSELRPYSKALLALVLKKDGRDAREVIAMLAKEAQRVGASAQFEGGTRGHWLDHSMEVSAAALRAFLAVDPKHEIVPKLVHWLSTVRQGNYWGSTKQTAMVVFAMTEYLAVSGDLEPDMTLSLTVNGKKIFGERITKANWAAFEGMRTFKGAQLLAGENEIVIEREGNGNPVWSIYAKYYAEGEVTASEGGIRVDRTFSKVINDGGKRVLHKLESGAEVTSGDEIEVMVTVTADRDYEWLMMDCPMPSGFEAVREYWGRPGWGRWGYWYSSKEFRDEKVSVAMTSLGAGTRQVSYVMRAEAPGRVRALPATVFNMYHPQIGGNSGEFKLTVKDR